MSDINWNVQLREIEREYDGMALSGTQQRRRPSAPIPRPRSRTQIRLQKIQEVIAKGRFDERLEIIGIWARLVLVGALATSLFWWPYGRDCGFPLAAFLVSEIMVIAGGLSLAACTWRSRLLWPFTGAAFFVFVAWTVFAVHAAPRIGYATSPAARAHWGCASRSS